MSMHDDVLGKQAQYEYAAWNNLVEEMRGFGVGEINAGQQHESLFNAMMRWSEELVYLRQLDPDKMLSMERLMESRLKVPLNADVELR